MRKQELDDIIKIIKEKIDLNEFLISNGEEVTIVELKDSGLKFTFTMDRTKFSSFVYYYDTYTGLTRGSENKTGRYQNVFDVKQAFKKWLTKDVAEFLKERDFPDPLEKLKAESKLFQNAEHDKGSFTSTEKETIKGVLGEFQKQIDTNFNLKEEVKKYVAEELKYLGESPERLNKRDWYAVARKVVYDIGINISSNLLISGGNAVMTTTLPTLNNTFVQIVLECFKALFK